MWNDQLLIARRLVEAGARCVTVAYGSGILNGANFSWLRQHLPLFDQGISALIEDLYARGLDRDVTVIVWGEFGRSPNRGRHRACRCRGITQDGRFIGGHNWATPIRSRLSLILKSSFSGSNSVTEFFLIRSIMALMSFKSTAVRR